MSLLPQTSRLFIGSSAEGCDVAHHLQAVLEAREVCEVEVWDQGVFEPSGYALDSLLTVAQRSDFAVLVASPDDLVMSRGDTVAAVRDNVIFEFGLFAGALGRNRTYLLSTGPAKLPSDAFGLTRLPYNERSDGNLRAAVNDSALRIADQVRRHGPVGPKNDISEGQKSETEILDRELDLLCVNAVSQGWTVKTNSQTTLRLLPPDRRRSYTLSKQGPRKTREQLRLFVADLRAGGLRVNNSVRFPVEESPY